MRRINSGKYRIPIIIQKRTESKDSYGQSEDDWTEHVKTRAGIFPLTANERFNADVISNEMTHKVHIRYTPGITPSMRVLLNDRHLYITSIANVEERNVELQLYCSEIVK